MDLPSPLDHAAFQSAVGTVIGYGLILAVMTVLLFAVPYGIFRFLL